MVCKGKVKGLDDYRVWDNSHVSVVLSSIDEIFPRKGISQCHLSTRCDLPADIKVL